MTGPKTFNQAKILLAVSFRFAFQVLVLHVIQLLYKKVGNLCSSASSMASRLQARLLASLSPTRCMAWTQRGYSWTQLWLLLHAIHSHQHRRILFPPLVFYSNTAEIGWWLDFFLYYIVISFQRSIVRSLVTLYLYVNAFLPHQNNN